MTVTELQALYAQVFAAWVRELDLQVRAKVTLRLPDGQVAAHATSTSALL